MRSVWRSLKAPPLLFSMMASAFGLFGCASPGPPRPPSLGIPRLAANLSAMRSGPSVSLQFEAPTRTTDGLPLRATTLHALICRQATAGSPCVPLNAKNMLTIAVPASDSPIQWTDSLPLPLLSGGARALAYRVELRTEGGRSAGFSDPVYAVAGLAPPPINGLEAVPMRLGISLTWRPVVNGGEVLLDRNGPPKRARTAPKSEAPAPDQPPAKSHRKKTAEPLGKSEHKATAVPGLEVLQAAPGDPSASRTVDAGVEEGVPYRYTALRRSIVKLDGRTLEMRSAPSASVEATWRDVYPPAAPTGLVALGYDVPGGQQAVPDTPPQRFAVDLVWQPVEDRRLAGYLVYREALNGSGEPSGARTKLTGSPVSTPGYHDGSAKADVRYRYSVTAIDPKGNESGAVTAVVEPQAR